MKFIKVFALFVLMQAGAWGGTHVYLSANQPDILVVVDTSFAMKPHFNDMRAWIDKYDANARYKNILVGTDKALLGDLDELPSRDNIFRTAFGRLTEANLVRLYSHVKSEERYLLSSGDLQPSGWKVITIQ